MIDKLLCAPGFGCADWSWDLDNVVSSTVAEFNLAEQLTFATTDAGLMRPSRILCHWLASGRFVQSATSEVQIGEGKTVLDALPFLLALRPPGVSDDAEPRWLEIGGPGVWFDVDGRERVAEGLLTLSVDLTNPDVSVQVFHDIWMTHDFHGVPHPEIHAVNAPRLTALLEQFSELLDAEAIAGEPTAYATPVGLTVRNALNFRGDAIDLGDMVDECDV